MANGPFSSKASLHRKLSFLLTLILIPLGTTCLSAQTQPVVTEITSVPYVITQPGRYVVRRHLKPVAADKNKPLIKISGIESVTLDLNGYTISGNFTDADSDSSISAVTGIEITNSNRVLVQNGTIDTCFQGMNVGSSTYNFSTFNDGTRIDNVRITNCRQYGISVGNSNSCVITDCQILGVGNAGEVVAYGIRGPSAAGVPYPSNYPTPGTPCISVSNCVISNIVTGSSGTSYGIRQVTFARGNYITNAQNACSATIVQSNLAYGCQNYFEGVSGGSNYPVY